MTSHYQNVARINYIKYCEVQAVIERLERLALNKAHGSEVDASMILRDEAFKVGGKTRKYKDLCADRARYAEIAQLNAMMAIMEQGTKE